MAIDKWRKGPCAMNTKVIGLAFCIVSFAVSAVGQTVVGSEFTESPNDTFTDTGHTMSNYGLTWADFSNGVFGPSAMLSGYGGINLYTSEARRLTITTFGNVGIGTESPVSQLDVSGYLHVSGNTNPTTQAQGAYLNWNALTGGTGEMDFINNQGGGSGGFAFMNTSPSGSPRTTLMFLNGGGHLGVGTTSPAYQLDVAGQIHTASGIVFPDGTVQTTAYPITSSGTPPLQVENNEVTINNGISADGNGIKHVRTNNSCTTGTTIGDTCQISVVWPGTPFTDTNYTVTCTPKAYTWTSKGATIAAYTILIPDANKTTTSTNVVVEGLGGGTTVTGLNCTAIHD
jgi:hypothetical protein